MPGLGKSGMSRMYRARSMKRSLGIGNRESGRGAVADSRFPRMKEYGFRKGQATMPLTVRRGTLEDAPIIVEFNRRLAEEREGKTLDLSVLGAGVARVLDDPHKGPYFLAEADGVPVGQMQVTYEFSDWRNGWFWWIQSVYVRPESRRQGVFRKLYHHVAEAAE